MEFGKYKMVRTVPSIFRHLITLNLFFYLLLRENIEYTECKFTTPMH